MARDDMMGVFNGLKELRPSPKVAAPMTLNMRGLEPQKPMPAKKKRIAGDVIQFPGMNFAAFDEMGRVLGIADSEDEAWELGKMFGNPIEVRAGRFGDDEDLDMD